MSSIRNLLADLNLPARPANNAALNSALALAKVKAADITSLGKFATNWDGVAHIAKIEVPPHWRSQALSPANLAAFANEYIQLTPLRVASGVQKVEPIAVKAPTVHVQLDSVVLTRQQQKAIDQFNEVIYTNPRGRAAMLPLKTGRGKSYICGALIKQLQDNNWNGRTNAFPECKVLYVTKKPVIEKTIRTFRRDFKIKNVGTSLVGNDVCVTHYGAFRAKANKIFFQTFTVEKFGNTTKMLKYAFDGPVLIILDEFDAVKKLKSKRTNYVLSFLYATRANETRWLMASATPAVVMADLGVFSIATGLEYRPGEPIDIHSFTDFAKQFIRDRNSTIFKPNKAMMKRAFEFFGPLIIRPPDDPLPYKVTYKLDIVDFTTDKERDTYLSAQENYIRALEAKGKSTSEAGVERAMFTILRQTEELLKVRHYVDRSIQAIKAGYSPVVAVSFQETLREYVLQMAAAGYSRDTGSVIWGGDKPIREQDVFTPEQYSELYTFDSNESLFKYDQLLQNIATMQSWSLFREVGVPLPEGVDYADDYDAEEALEYLKELILDLPVLRTSYPDITWSQFKTRLRKTKRFMSDRIMRRELHDEAAERREHLHQLRLVAQSDSERQSEIDKFQSGQTLYCVFTLAAGGTGLDLDHQNPNARPRKEICTICYFAEEFVQACGRCARIATRSDVEISFLFFANTIAADHVLPKLGSKLASLDVFAATGADLVSTMEQSILKQERNTEPVVTQVDGASTLALEDEGDGDDDDE